jgi:hypothetical protein
MAHWILLCLLSQYLKMDRFKYHNSSKFDFLVPCRLRDFIQDIGIHQFDWNAFIKAYIVGVSV